ncbi:hypothetical protein [Limnohabitans sp.]|nr:hypothetical protein [Limnohabitans sp.]
MRKVLGDGGAGLNALLDELSSNLNSQAPQEAHVLHLFAQLRAITQEATQVQTHADGHVTLSWIAGDYLRVATLALLAWAWTRIEAAQPTDAARWHASASALRAWILPEFDMRLNIIRAQFKSA